MGVFQHVRHWLRDRTPIPEPDILTLRIDGGLNNFGALEAPREVALPFLRPPELTQDLGHIPACDNPADFSLRPHALKLTRIEDIHPDHPELTEIPFDALLEVPAILDLFTGLTLPGYAGKAYADDDESPNTLDDTGELDLTICPHGLPRYTCDICSKRQQRRERRKRRKISKKVRKPHTLDVFDLLLPFLQPPIETHLDQPLLFPEDRRPYDYQIKGIQFLFEHSSALLGDEMGLGKTIQTIVALQVLFRRAEIFKVLILCRRSLLGTWEHELTKWAPELFILKVRGTRDERVWLWRAPASVYLTTYSTARQDVFRDRGSILPKFDVVVLDEVQEIKNPSAKKTRAMRHIPADYRWGLSGTPVENKPEDVVSIFNYLRPKLFRRSDHYSPTSVKRKIEPYFLRRRAADVLDDLPDKISREVWLDLSPAQEKRYERAFSEARQSLKQTGATRTHALSLITELQKICNRDSITGRSSKVDYLIDQLGTVVESGQKALIFSRLPNVTLRKIMPGLRAYKPALFYGGLNDAEREELIDRFQSEEPPYIMLMSVQTGSVGLNLQRANHVFHFDHWWNPAVTKQAEGRAHRIGQTRKVFVHHLYTRDTVEERVYEIIKRKQRVFDQIIDDLSEEYVSSTFSDEELFGVFGLKPPDSSKRRSRTSQEAQPRKEEDRSDARDVESVRHMELSKPEPKPKARSEAGPDDDVKRELADLVRKRRRMIDSPERLVNSLGDLCPKHEYEVDLIQMSLDEGIPDTLNAGRDGPPPAILRATLAHRLVSHRGVRRSHADWVVDAWVDALNRRSRSESATDRERSVDLTEEMVEGFLDAVRSAFSNMSQ